MTNDNPQETTMSDITTDQQRDQEQEQHSDDSAKLVSESKKYRQRAQQAEQALANLEGRHTNLIRSVVDQQATAAGVKPTAFWAAGTTPEDLLTEDGALDFTKIEQAINHTRDHFGIPVGGSEAPGQGLGSPKGNKIDWAEAFRQG